MLWRFYHDQHQLHIFESHPKNMTALHHVQGWCHVGTLAFSKNWPQDLEEVLANAFGARAKQRRQAFEQGLRMAAQILTPGNRLSIDFSERPWRLYNESGLCWDFLTDQNPYQLLEPVRHYSLLHKSLRPIEKASVNLAVPCPLSGHEILEELQTSVHVWKEHGLDLYQWLEDVSKQTPQYHG